MIYPFWLVKEPIFADVSGEAVHFQVESEVQLAGEIPKAHFRETNHENSAFFPWISPMKFPVFLWISPMPMDVRWSGGPGPRGPRCRPRRPRAPRAARAAGASGAAAGGTVACDGGIMVTYGESMVD